MNEISLSKGMKILWWLLVFQALGVAITLLIFPAQTELFFFWKIVPPINAVLLGALYTSTVIFGAHAALRRRWETARYLVPMLTYSSAMLTIVTLVHIDKFIPGLKLNAWLASYILAPLALNWFYWRNQKDGGTWEITGRDVLPATRLAALTFGGLILTLSLTALLFPNLITASAPWPMSPLIVRAFASIWGAFSIGPLWFARERDWYRLYPIADMLTLMPIFWLLIIILYPHDATITIASAWPLLTFLGVVMISGLSLRGLQMKS